MRLCMPFMTTLVHLSTRLCVCGRDGRVPVITVSGQMCTLVPASASRVSVTCLAPPRSNFSSSAAPVRVVVDGQLSNVVTLVYDGPVVLAVSPTTYDAVPAPHSAVPRPTVTVTGVNFGRPDAAIGGT